jgi:hypothetical protein
MFRQTGHTHFARLNFAFVYRRADGRWFRRRDEYFVPARCVIMVKRLNDGCCLPSWNTNSTVANA